MSKSLTLKVSPEKQEEIKHLLEKLGFIVEVAPYSFWRARGEETTITFYKSGKLLFQGEDIGHLVDILDYYTNMMSNENSQQEEYIGTDEAGKGDYFGPLIVAGVLMNKDSEKKLLKLGVKDSKELSDSTIKTLAPIIREEITNSTLVIMPKTYNALFKKMKSINRILVWAHFKVVENILKKEKCKLVICDKFGKSCYLEDIFKGKNIKILQYPHAERFTGVAAASILARYEFLKRLEYLSKEFSMVFPKGCSGNTKDIAKLFVKKHGENQLEKVAKLHFKITNTL